MVSYQIVDEEVVLVFDPKEKKVVPVSDIEDKGEVILREGISEDE
jgi:hypothetical protein